MPSHPDAIGYLNDLATEVRAPWLKMVCDLAISGATSLDQNCRDTLVAIFTKRASYVSIPIGTVTNTPALQPRQQIFLKRFPDFQISSSWTLNFNSHLQNA